MAKSQAAKGKSTAVVQAKSSSMVLVQDEVPEYLQGATQARGSENVGMEDIVIPRLELIQGLSPAVKPGDPGEIDGAKMGMMNNSVTRELYGDTVYVVPVYYTKQWLVWRARKDKKGKSQEGGFFGAFNTPEEAQARADKENDESIEIIDTPQHLCLLIKDDGTTEEILISLPRTKAKVSRKWNSQVRLAGGDRFSRVYQIGTVLEKNSQGDFYNFDIKMKGYPAKELFKKAEALYNSVAAGDRKVVMDVSGFDGDEKHSEDEEM